MNTPAAAPATPCRRRAILLCCLLAVWLAPASLAHAQAVAAVADRTPTVGSGWSTERQPELANFNAWALRYAKTPDAVPLADGAPLAERRRAVLSALVQTDPARAMAASVPAGIRSQLPAAVQSLLETPFSVVGDLAVDGASGKRSITVDGHTYPAHVYGRTVDAAAASGVPLRGFVLDGEAVLDANPRLVPTKVRAIQTPITSTIYGNDPFNGAFQLFGTTGSISDDNFGATKEGGEPNHAGSMGGASVWYSFTPTDSGEATFITDDGTGGGTVDTLLAVYTSSPLNPSVDSLSLVVSDDDANGGLNSQVSFYARAGVTYYIAVDGYLYTFGPSEGNYTLNYFQQGNPFSPSITSDTTADAELNAPFEYDITATNTPTSFFATGLPAGLSIDTATGVITGTPTAIGNYLVLISATNSDGTGTINLTIAVSDQPVRLQFFRTEVALPRRAGVYYLHLPRGEIFGYYAYLEDANYLYHFDLGYEYIFDANDGKAGIYLYDFASSTFFYTSPTFGFPYLYDFKLNTVLYYYPDPRNEGRYNTDGVRYFYDFSTGQIITK